MTIEDSDHKTRTIILTNHARVRIREDLWPIIASVQRPDINDHWHWHLTARRHADGRQIVYGSSTYKGPRPNIIGHEEAHAGEIVELDGHLVMAIFRVCNQALCPASMANECIANLPVEDIDAPIPKPPSSNHDHATILRELLLQARPHCPDNLKQLITMALKLN
jgi:hypothetical protein